MSKQRMGQNGTGVEASCISSLTSVKRVNNQHLQNTNTGVCVLYPNATNSVNTGHMHSIGNGVDITNTTVRGPNSRNEGMGVPMQNRNLVNFAMSQNGGVNGIEQVMRSFPGTNGLSSGGFGGSGK